MNMQCFKSKAVTAAGYEAGELQIVFTNGAIWSYVGVNVEVWEKMLAAESKGSFYANEIKGKYHGKQLKLPDLPPMPPRQRPPCVPTRGKRDLPDLAMIFGEPELVEPDYLDEDA